MVACHALLTRCHRSRSRGAAYSKIVSSSSGIPNVLVDGSMLDVCKVIF